jgi:hypothetical protein
MLVLECLSPLSQKQATCRQKTQVIISLKQMNTCAELSTAISNRIQTLHGKQTCQTFTHIVCQVHSLSFHLFNCLVQDLNYGPWPVTPVTSLDGQDIAISLIKNIINLKIINRSFVNVTGKIQHYYADGSTDAT